MKSELQKSEKFWLYLSEEREFSKNTVFQGKEIQKCTLSRFQVYSTSRK